MRKIAFLFLTINDIHFPDIWNQYFKGHKDHISILAYIVIQKMRKMLQLLG